MAGSRTTPRKPKQDPAPQVETFFGSLEKTVVTAITKVFPEAELATGASALRDAINKEQQAWLNTANLLHTWKEKFLAKDLSISDHFEPWAAQVTGKGVASIRTYLTGRRVALEQGISTMSKEVLQSVSMYDVETAGRILAESGGDIGKTREIKQRMKLAEAENDPEAAAKELVNRSNRIKKFASTFKDEIRATLASVILGNQTVDAATAGEIWLDGFRQGALRMAPKTGLVRAEEMTAGAASVVADLHGEAAAASEAEQVKTGDLPPQ